MTAAGFRKLLAEWKLTQVEAARLLGVGERAVKEWARLDGPGVLNPAAARFLAYMKATGATPAVVEEIVTLAGER